MYLRDKIVEVQGDVLATITRWRYDYKGARRATKHLASLLLIKMLVLVAAFVFNAAGMSLAVTICLATSLAISVVMYSVYAVDVKLEKSRA
ncbi:hypothetical protein SEA_STARPLATINUM_163 [Streptomyces phage StarPlatinum]|uniref:Uncharacterized protein n=1 Tax=Streptomyces phage StarPlatinum TaxID=2283265 RepID=A0A345M8S0_9CAUD|nr:hypothetical protein HWB77_gp146 [Streptomyces phage StarPlatinum]AXH66891.1 hypothetical protein SEA_STARPLATINUM_163 [Streptomyces phage StarPlatinum]